MFNMNVVNVNTVKQWLLVVLTCTCILLLAFILLDYTGSLGLMNIIKLSEAPLPNKNHHENHHEYSRLVQSQEQVKTRFQKRSMILQEACRRHGNSTTFRQLRAHFSSLPVYRPLMNVSIKYCPIPKTASTTWHGIFDAIRAEMSSRRIKGDNDVTKADKEIYFTFVREPYSRLVSAYTDKLFSPNPLFWGTVGKFIVNKFRANATSKSLECGHDVTFPEFIKYIIHAQTTGEHRDGHFIPTHDQCEMCQVPYQYIGHLETINEDMPYILREMQSPVDYMKDFDSETIYGNSRMVLKLFRSSVQKCIGLDEACRRIWKKWHVRGIISKTQPFPLTSSETYNISLDSFHSVGLSALARSDEKAIRRLQKKEALREAFGGVPLEDRLELQRLLFLDFEMFGFEPSPEEVFPKTPYNNNPAFSYFKLY